MTERDQPWSHRITLADVPEEGLHIALEADSDVRAALARIANLREVPQLEASFDLRRKATGVHLAGEVIGIIGQNCVVTLEPISVNLHEVIDLLFVPTPADTLGDSAGEATFGLTDAEPPEPLIEGSVDLGAIATEYFLLGIDPYPRKEGAIFEAAIAPEPAESPFAALEALRDPGNPTPKPAKKPPLGRK